ncbi:DUF305 domain-containing protein [Nocardia sp. NPDC004068]|uniref:DUF305 domain-containing protein n=1 Tax=Nocardia sp. NPDC004068 TaxID=3364303 RepID=UPI00368CE0DD
MFGPRTRTTLAGTGIAVALLMAGCSNGDDTASPATTTMSGMNHGGGTTTADAGFADADITFLQMMYPHHAQALDMAKLVPGRSPNPQVIALAAEIEKAQAPEMQQITDLLRAAGRPAPSADMGHDMPGMMTHDEMTALQGLSGADFDREWLRMMIAHHQGAVTMSDTELTDGRDARTKALAQAIVTAQQAEIDRMHTLLTQS